MNISVNNYVSIILNAVSQLFEKGVKIDTIFLENVLITAFTDFKSGVALYLPDVNIVEGVAITITWKVMYESLIAEGVSKTTKVQIFKEHLVKELQLVCSLSTPNFLQVYCRQGDEVNTKQDCVDSGKALLPYLQWLVTYEQ